MQKPGSLQKPVKTGALRKDVGWPRICLCPSRCPVHPPGVKQLYGNGSGRAVGATNPSRR